MIGGATRKPYKTKMKLMKSGWWLCVWPERCTVTGMNELRMQTGEEHCVMILRG